MGEMCKIWSRFSAAVLFESPTPAFRHEAVGYMRNIKTNSGDIDHSSQWEAQHMFIVSRTDKPEIEIWQIFDLYIEKKHLKTTTNRQISAPI